jgi:hypothetical protein
MGIKQLFIIAGITVLVTIIILGVYLYEICSPSQKTSDAAEQPKKDATQIKPIQNPLSPTTTTAPNKTIQPSFNQQPKSITTTPETSNIQLIPKVNAWKEKYSYLFQENPELEKMLNKSKRAEAINLLLSSRFLKEAMEILVYLVDESLLKDLPKTDYMAYENAFCLIEQRYELIKEIIKFLSDHYVPMRKNALYILCNINCDISIQKEAVKEITAIFSSSDAEARRAAVACIRELQNAQMRGFHREFHPNRLVISNPDPEQNIYSSSIAFIPALDFKESLPEIIKLLSDADSEVRRETLMTLCTLNAKETTPETIKLLYDSNPEVRSQAMTNLVQFKAKEVIPEIIKLLYDSETKIRIQALNALGWLGAKESAPEMMKLLSDSNAQVRKEAIYNLGELMIKESIPEIEKLLFDPDENVRKMAESTLHRLKD